MPLDKDNIYRTKHSIFITDKKLALKKFKIKMPTGFGLKIFWRNHWQKSKINDIAKIENILWINGISARVIEKIKIKYQNIECPALIIESIKSKDNDDYIIRIDDLERICKENFIKINYEGKNGMQEINNRNNWIKDKYIDLGGFKFKDKNKYFEKLKKDIIKYTYFGSGFHQSYQSSFDFEGKRKTNYRIKKYELDKIDFNGKSVLDLGCNLGLFCHYAKKRGAKDVLGIDKNKEAIKCAKEYANWKELYNINFKAKDLNNFKPKPADIVFFLAVSQYLGFPEWLGEITKEVLIYEGHANEELIETKEKLEKIFPRVDEIGYSEDRSKRPILKCYKEAK